VGILGHNGVGKSTLIKAIVSIHDADDGEILIAGKNNQINEMYTKTLVGFVNDEPCLYDNLSGRKYLNYIADIYGVSASRREEIITGVSEALSIDKDLDSPLGTYSKGMKQKVAIIASLINDPLIWILDEPLNGLDLDAIAEIKGLMREVANRGSLVLFSTHLIDVAQSLCDDVVFLTEKGASMCPDFRSSDLSLEEMYNKIK